MGRCGAYRHWLPPQREPGQSTRRYLEILDDTMKHLDKVIADPAYNREQREKWQTRYGRCVQAREKAILEDR